MTSKENILGNAPTNSDLLKIRYNFGRIKINKDSIEENHIKSIFIYGKLRYVI